MTLAVDTRAPETAGSGRLPWLATFARPDRAIVGPIADFLCIYGAPPLALLFIGAIAMLPAAQISGGTNFTMAALGFAISAISSAHLAPVFVRSHLNPSIFAAHRWKLTVVPPLLLVTLCVSKWAFVIAGVISIFWDVYHTAQQNFGLARIYDGKAGATSPRGRMLDRVFSHVMYLGPIIAGASFAEHLRALNSLKDVGLAAMTALPQAAEGYAATLRLAAFVVMAIACAGYLFAQWRLTRGGQKVSPHKVALLTTTVAVQFIAWAFCPPAVAFMVVNLFHAVQYFALVWRQEGEKAPAHLGLKSKSFARPLAIALIFVAPALYGISESASAHAWNVLTATFLTVTLLHFWMDGFIWSVRKKTV